MNINEFIVNNFKLNIEYFQQYYPALYKKIVDFEVALDGGYYQERYKLIYENDSFDVVELSTENSLYNLQSLSYAKRVASSINYDFSEDAFATFAISTNKDKEGMEFLELLEDSTSKELCHIDKFVFFGVGLGLHLASVDKKIDAQSYLIVEDDLELFRLSLFTVNYQEFSQDKKLFFSVFEDQDEFSKSVDSFLEYKFYLNHYIKFFLMLSHSKEKVELFHLVVSKQPHLSFHYTDMFEQLTSSIPMLLSDYKYLDKSTTLQNEQFNQQPFLLLASGPSLSNNRLWLQENQDKFLIVAVSSALAFLQKYNIKVDIIISLDAFKNQQSVFENIQHIEYFQDSICLFSDKLKPKIYTFFDVNNIFLFETITRYKRNSLKPSSPCVGSLSLQLLLIFGVKNMYLLGLDLGLDNETLSTHIGEHLFAKQVEKKDDDSDIIEYKKTILEVDGNFNTKVKTTPHFFSSIEFVNQSISFFKKDYQTIYNLSNGAKFIDTIAIHAEDISLVKQDVVTITKDDISNVFNKDATVGLTEFEKNDIFLKVAHAQNLKRRFENFNYQDIVLDEKFLEELILLNDSLNDTKELDHAVMTYFKSSLSYIFHFYNLKSKNDPKLIKQIKTIVCYAIIRNIDKYITRLSEIK